MTPYVFQVGDFCYIYKINNQLSNSFICDKIIPAGESELTLGEERLIPQIKDAELITNKTTVISGDSSDDQYPSARAVYVALSQAITQEWGAYVVDADANEVFATDVSQLTVNTAFVDIGGVEVSPASLKVGSSIFIVQDQYPNRWVYTVDATTNSAVLMSTRVDSGAGTVDDLVLDGISVVSNNVATLTTGNGLSSTTTGSVGEISLDISTCEDISLSALTYSQMDNLNIYLQGSDGTGYKAPISQLPYTRVVVQNSSSEDWTAVRENDFIFSKNN